MWKPFERTRVRFALPRIRYSKLGITGVVSLIALALISLAGWLLDFGGGNPEAVQRFGEYARQARQDPVEAIVAGARAHRFVFLSDISGSMETKRLANLVVEAMANGPGLDAVVLEVGQDQQAYIDRYIDLATEDASVLLSHPRTIGDAGSASRDNIELYHRIWQLNEKLGADRRINVIAADLQGWPDERARSTTERARRFADRDQAMVDHIEREVLGSSPRARLLVFTTGLHALKRGQGLLQTGGSATVEARWLAARLEERYPGEVYSVLVDAPGSGSPGELVPYTGTRVPKAAEKVLPAGRYALPVGDAFDFVSRPIEENGAPGLHFEIAPRSYRMKDVADLYVYLGR